jgi:hypothetical protein
MRKLISLLLFLVFFHGLFFGNFFASLTAGSLGFTIFVTGFHLFLGLSFFKKDFWQKHREGLAFSLLAVLFSWLAVLRGDRAFIDRILWLATFGFTLLTINDYAQKSPKLYSLYQIISLPLTLTRYFFNSFLAEKNKWDKQAKPKNYWLKNSGSFLRGLIIATPITALLLLLLNQADPIFAQVFKNFFQSGFLVFLKRLASTLLWLFLLWPLINMVIEEKAIFLKTPKKNKKWLVEMGVIIVLTAIILGWFLLIQFHYLFANVPETQLIRYGVKTYSEYVSRGFTELIFVSLLVYLMVRLNLILGSTRLSFFLLAELALLIISVFRRLFLYQIYHGLTVARVYGLIFLIWLVMMMIVLFLRHFFNKRWILVEVLATASFLIFIGVFNTEKTIALFFPPRVNNEVDEIYLASLSPDGYLGWLRAYHWAKNQAIYFQNKTAFTPDDSRKLDYAFTVVSILINQYNQLSLKGKDWYKTNFSEKDAFQKMKKEMPEKKLMELEEELWFLNNKIPQEIKKETPKDRAPGRFFKLGYQKNYE